ncbi:MAG TPA: hypothetical protein VJ785_07770 [Anaerolineales bacterium]|nr:hypothetical protein [Anaerolineales bacterium]
MSLLPDFEYRRLGEFTYHVLSRPADIKDHLLKWSLREWESDHNEAPYEHWTIEWMEILPKMEFSLAILQLENIHPHLDLWRVQEFQASLRERADEREAAMLRGVSIAPLLVNQHGFQLMDGYTRYVVLESYHQREVFVYLGQA